MKTRHPNIRVWVALLFCVNAVACVRSLDGSKVRCSQSANCPSGYTCSAGRCVVNGGSSSYDGAAGEADGTSRLSDASAGGGSDGAEEVGLTDGWASGGSGGNVPADAPSASGGTTAADAPISTGGSPSDAPISSGGITPSGGVPATGGSASTPDGSGALQRGSLCTADSQCIDSHCVDGVCCNAKCDSTCQACNETGSVGFCKTVQGDPRGARPACIGSGKCKGQCDGMNATACLMPGSSTVCQAASCMNGSAIAASTCNGSGACVTPAAKQCTSNLCAADGSGTCAGSCTSTSCGAGYYCHPTGNCAQKKPSGTGTCLNGAECFFRSLLIRRDLLQFGLHRSMPNLQQQPGNLQPSQRGSAGGWPPGLRECQHHVRGKLRREHGHGVPLPWTREDLPEVPLALPIPHRQSRRP